jgi:hypothetical protein
MAISPLSSVRSDICRIRANRLDKAIRPAAFALGIGPGVMKLSNHACPVCGRPVGASRWFWRAWIWAQWHCASCDTLLRFDFRRRLLMGLFIGLFNALVMAITILCMLSQISQWIWVPPLLCIFIGWAWFICTRCDRIIVATENKTGPHALPNDASFRSRQ